jgi:hypothetical protein
VDTVSYNYRVNVLLGCMTFLLVAVCIGVWLWSRSYSPKVIFRLPSGFDGPFVVMVREREYAKPLLVQDTYEFQIPASGILVASDDRILSVWHTAFAGISGDPLVPLSMPSESDRRKDVFYSDGLQKRDAFRIHWYYFGSAAETSDSRKRARIEEALEKLRKESAEKTATSKTGESLNRGVSS